MPAPIPIALINNEQTPYRIHLHQRLVRELPALQIWSLFTHEQASSPWRYRPVEEIRPVQFGSGEHSAGQSSPRFFWREWRKGGRIIRWMRQHGIQAVVLGGYNDAARIRIILWCRRNGIPCFLFGDSNIRGDATGWKQSIKSLLLPRILGLCSGAFYCGTLGREYFLRYGVPSERLFPFPYQPDFDRIAGVTSTTKNTIRHRFGIPEQARLLLYSGRLVPVKRVDLLLDAFRSIASQRPDWHIVIAGDGPLRATLQSSVPPELHDRVHWTGFVDDPDTLAALYAASDVLVLPSDWEPWGVVVTEAAVHLAIVASSAVGAAADLVRDHENGRIFPAGSLPDLIVCLREVTSPDRIDEMKAASPAILAAWRRTADPVAGLQSALRLP